MNTKNGNTLAMPFKVGCQIQLGLTKREYFAAAALSGMVVGRDVIGGHNEIAKMCRGIADAVLEELDK